MSRTYISGPITGFPDLNKPAFDAAEALLRSQGAVDIFNPHSVPAPQPDCAKSPDELWRYYMKACVRELALCDIVYFLAGWQNSRGAVWEHKIADMLGLKMLYAPVHEEPKW
jgi:hypothetical protein